jgi:hypothetical protein
MQFLATLPQATGVLPTAEELADFAKNLLNCFVIALVAYIATNVVREMLQMRIRYQDGVDKVVEIDKALSNRQTSVVEQNEALNEVTRTLKNQVMTIASSTGIIEFAGLLRLMLEKCEPKLLGLIETAFKNISKEAQAVHDRLQAMAGYGDQLQRMYLHVFNPYVEAELKAFALSQDGSDATYGAGRESGGIVTRFSVAGEMVRGLLGAEGLGVTFHALLVIPPVRFLNYGHPPGWKHMWQDLFAGDQHWQRFLQANYDAAESGIVERQFLSLTCNSEGELEKLPHELRSLTSQLIERQLKLWVRCNNGVPSLVEKPNAVANGRREWYAMAEKPGEGEWLQLADLIGSRYHEKGKCFVREIPATEFIDSDSRIGTLLRDRTRTGKPMDYFAARQKESKDWLFCLRMRYDDDFDVAILDILYPGRQDWNALKNDLDFLFDSQKQQVEITEYATRNA